MAIAGANGYAQRLAFGDLGIQFVYEIKRISKPQAFHLTYKLMELYEKEFPPLTLHVIRY